MEGKHRRGNTEKSETTNNAYRGEILAAEIKNMNAINKNTASEVLLYASNCRLAAIQYGKETVWKGRTFCARRNERRRIR